MARGAALAEAIARLEERFGSSVVLPGGAREERGKATGRLAFGVASLDTLVDGGLAPGEPYALLGAASSGATTLAFRLAAAAQASGGDVAWLDPTRSFDPLTAAAAGLELDRVLLVRADEDDVAFAGSVLARSSAFVLVVLDLGKLRAAATDLATIVARARAARVPLLVLGEHVPSRASIPVVTARRAEWLREGCRLVGWRSEVTRAHDGRIVRLAFAPLALPPRPLVDEGVVETRLEAVG